MQKEASKRTLKVIKILLIAISIAISSSINAAELLVDLGSPLNANGASPSQVRLVADAGGKSYFTFRDQLWVTNGTRDGTILLSSSFDSSAEFNSINDGILYFTSDRNFSINRLYRSDGTPGGTFEVAVLPGSLPDRGAAPLSTIFWTDDIGYFSSDGSNGEEPYVTDGTRAGTRQLLNIRPDDVDIDIPEDPPEGSKPSNFASSGSGVTFFATDDSGRQLWQSDGTEQGTQRLSSYDPSVGTILREDGSEVIYNVDGMGIYKIDRASPSTPAEQLVSHSLRVDNLNGSANALFISSSNLFVIARQFDVFTGFPSIFSINIDSGDVSQSLGSLPDMNFFSAQHTVDDGESILILGRQASTGFEPYKVNEQDGIRLIRDIREGLASSLQPGPDGFTPIVFRENIIFTAFHPSYGSELWRTDGSQSGTQLVRDIRPLVATSGADTQESQNINGRLYFTANDGSGSRVWSTDSTAQGTRPVVTGSPLAQESFLRSRGSGRILFTGSQNGNLQLYITEIDTDNDGASDLDDNCIDIVNSNQLDTDGDGDGNLCDNDDDNDGISDAYETANGLNPILASDAGLDSDGDGFTNLEEFRNGTNPNIANPDCNGDGQRDAVDRCLVIAPIYNILMEER